ncbi:hypothetical protein IWX90DRAFT_8840 [Phyllosticta citrichinensis]|uniref:Uncharacterized protein n=1 Tax=Phyllosticta citrichinensis TaxID=1130410 RepID=A0ABR1Y6N0_9PEZI
MPLLFAPHHFDLPSPPHSSAIFAPSRPVLALRTTQSTYSTMGNGETVNGHDILTLQKALDLARESESGVDPAVSAFLQRELASLWSRLVARPDDYVFTRDEFGLFNYFRSQWPDNDLAGKAIQRFWNHYRLNNGS